MSSRARRKKIIKIKVVKAGHVVFFGKMAYKRNSYNKGNLSKIISDIPRSFLGQAWGKLTAVLAA
jgi:hypothetical protein